MNLLEGVEKAGVIGCGGAGFPTHIKWKARAESFIINAVECEPLLSTDKYLMRHRAEDLISVCCSVAEMLQAKETVVAIKGSYREEIAALEKAIKTACANIKVHRLQSFLSGRRRASDCLRGHRQKSSLRRDSPGRGCGRIQRCNDDCSL